MQTQNEPAAGAPARAAGDARREALRAELTAQIPPWYRPWAHLIVPAIVGITAVALALRSLHNLRPVELLLVPALFVLFNAFEWRLHKYLLHRRNRRLPLLYERHTPMHHALYIQGDMSMRDRREFRFVLLPASFVVVFILVPLPPLTLLLVAAGQRNCALLLVATAICYVLSYEWLHLSYHLPPESWIGRRRLIRRLAHHHATHHRPDLMQRWNLNVTLPLWDWVKGTIYREPVADGSARPKS